MGEDGELNATICSELVELWRKPRLYIHAGSSAKMLLVL